MKEEASLRNRYERSWIDALFPRDEMWKSTEGIFSNQGKYAVEISKKIWYVGL